MNVDLLHRKPRAGWAQGLSQARAGPQSVTDEKSVRSSSGLIVIAAAQDDKRTG